MSYYYLFALNHLAIADHKSHHPLDSILGEALAAFSEDSSYGWCPRDVTLDGDVLLKRLALLDYDATTVAIEVDGFSFTPVGGKQFQSCDRNEFEDRLAGGALTAPADLNKLFQEKIDSFNSDPVAYSLSRTTHPQEGAAEGSDVIATVYVVREEVISSLQDARAKKSTDLLVQTGAALLALVSNINAPTINVAGINRTPAIRKAIIVRPGPPSVCVWVFNGLHVVENFDERHWRTLEHKKLISA